MTHRAAGDDHLRRNAEEPRYREPPLIGISAPWRWQAKQTPDPQQESAEPGAAFMQLAEALRPYGFRWPHERQASQPASQLTAESLFLQAGQSQIAYVKWKTGTQPNLRLVRLFLLMQRGWNTAAIEEAISEPALASWWLSGEATAWRRRRGLGPRRTGRWRACPRPPTGEGKDRVDKIHPDRPAWI